MCFYTPGKKSYLPKVTSKCVRDRDPESHLLTLHNVPCRRRKGQLPPVGWASWGVVSELALG